MRRPTHLRPFHHRGDAPGGLLRLAGDPDPEYSSSEQSCDTVIYVGPDGAAVSDRELTDNEGPPACVPIVPVMLRGKGAEPPPATPPAPQGQGATAGGQSTVRSPRLRSLVSQLAVASPCVRHTQSGYCRGILQMRISSVNIIQ